MNKPVKYHAVFKKHFRQRIKNKKRLFARFSKQLELFEKNPEDPKLRSHKLKGKQGDYKSFWISGEYRVIYKETEKFYLFYDIGTHEEVYTYK